MKAVLALGLSRIPKAVDWAALGFLVCYLVLLFGSAIGDNRWTTIIATLVSIAGVALWVGKVALAQGVKQ